MLRKILFILITNMEFHKKFPGKLLLVLVLKVGDVTASASSLGYSHADIGSSEDNKYSANYGGH